MVIVYNSNLCFNMHIEPLVFVMAVITKKYQVLAILTKMLPTLQSRHQHLSLCFLLDIYYQHTPLSMIKYCKLNPLIGLTGYEAVVTRYVLRWLE